MNIIAETEGVEGGLSRLLDQVEAGGEVVITRHGRAVAKLVPLARVPRARFLGFGRIMLGAADMPDGVKVADMLSGLDHDKHNDPDWQAMVRQMEGRLGP